MDFKKIFLIVGLVVIGYLLVLNWSQEYDQHQPHSIASNDQNGNRQPNSEEPLPKPESTTLKNNDVPEVTEQPLVDSAEQAQRKNQSLISVSTGYLDVRIDSQTGNIVYLALPLYLKSHKDSNPFVLLDDSSERTFIAQSGLVGLNVKGYTSESLNYKMAANQESLTVNLHQIIDQIKVTKQYIFHKDSYAVDVMYIIDNQSNSSWSGNFYAQLKRDNSKDPDLTGKHGTSMASYLGGAIKTNDSRFKKIKFSDFGNSPKERTEGGYAAILQHYFVTAWVPPQSQYFNYTARKVSDYNILGFYGNTISVQPGQKETVSSKLYAGPKIDKDLKKLAPGMELTVDYGWLWFIASPMFSVLSFLHKIFGNWGWSIILLTALIKLMFYPLSAASYRSMAKMRALQPKMKQLKERYGDDRQKMSQELMQLYKKEKVNPMGGCLPILVQMPFFIALYEVLIEAVQLRQAPWIFWIHDLSVMDPFLILPFLMGGSMFIQQRLSPAPPDPTQAKVMRLMPIMFTIFFIWFPAGLVLYWVTNNCLSIMQQWWITKKCEEQAKIKAK